MSRAYVTEALSVYLITEIEGIKAESSFSSITSLVAPLAFGFLEHFCSYILRGPIYAEGIKLSGIRRNQLKDDQKTITNIFILEGLARDEECAIDLSCLS